MDVTELGTRRDFFKSAANSIAVLSLCDLAILRRAIAAPVEPIINRWVREANDLARAVKTETVSQIHWQDQMAALYSRVPLADLLRFIDFEKLVGETELPENGESFQAIVLPQVDGISKPVFYRDLAGFRKGCSIPPHGHNHLVSSFLVLRGELHGRHFDRVKDENDHIHVTPTIDRVFKAGEFSTVSQDKDNVHWFTALTNDAFMFDIGVGGLKYTGATVPFPGSDKLKSGRIYIDIDHAEKSPATSLLRAKLITREEAYLNYGKQII